LPLRPQVAFPTLVKCYGDTQLHGEALLRPPADFRRAFSNVGNIPAGETPGIAILGPPGQWLRSKLCDFVLVSSTVGELDARVPGPLMVPTRRELICDALIVGQKPGQLVHLGLRELVGMDSRTRRSTAVSTRRPVRGGRHTRDHGRAPPPLLGLARGGDERIAGRHCPPRRRFWERGLDSRRPAPHLAATSGYVSARSRLGAAVEGKSRCSCPSVLALNRCPYSRFPFFDVRKGIGAPQLTVDAVIESGDPMLAAVWLIACSRYWSPPQGVAAPYPSQRPLLMADELSDRALWVALDLNGLGTCLPVNTAAPAPVASPKRPTPPRFTLEGFFTTTNEQQSATYAANAVAALSPPFVVKY
jgi:hypothetical protein